MDTNTNGNAIGFSITYEDMLRLWDSRYDELMSLPKEKLIEMIIGRREDVGILRG